MRFEELDVRLRAFETNDDHCVLPGLHIVVRLDGRGFTRQTREVWRLDALDLELPVGEAYGGFVAAFIA